MQGWARHRRTLATIADQAAVRASKEWDDLALNHPLIHGPSNTRIHLVGVHHNSPLSVQRVKTTIQKVQPAIVCVEADRSTLHRYTAKHAIISQTKPSPNFDHMQVIKSSSNAHTNSSQSLNQSQLSKLALLGSDFDVNTGLPLSWGMEIGTAVAGAKSVSAHIKAIDMTTFLNPRQLSSTEQAFISFVREKYRVWTPPGVVVSWADSGKGNRRQASSLGDLLFKSLHAVFVGGSWAYLQYVVGSLFNITRLKEKWLESMVEDRAGVQQIFYSGWLWKLFYPTEHFHMVELRDAIMVENLRRLAESMASEKGPEQEKVLVCVVGKSHVFGITRFWNQFVADRPFSTGKHVKPVLELVDDVPELNNVLDSAEQSRKRVVQVIQGDSYSEITIDAAMSKEGSAAKFKYIDA